MSAIPQGWSNEDVDAVAACLGDDAAQLREENKEDERADNMDRAASMLTWMLLTHPALSAAPLPPAETVGEPVATELTNDLANSYFVHIAHGDEEHRAWLKRETFAWFRSHSRFLAHPATAAMEEAVEALRLARRCMEPLTGAQIKLHGLPQDAAEKIDAALSKLEAVKGKTE